MSTPDDPPQQPDGRRLPRLGQIALAVVLAVVVLAVLFTWVFPWVERNLSDPTLGSAAVLAVTAPGLRRSVRLR